MTSSYSDPPHTGSDGFTYSSSPYFLDIYSCTSSSSTSPTRLTSYDLFVNIIPRSTLLRIPCSTRTPRLMERMVQKERSQWITSRRSNQRLRPSLRGLFRIGQISVHLEHPCLVVDSAPIPVLGVLSLTVSHYLPYVMAVTDIQCPPVV